MRIVIQRVTQASVTIDGKLHSTIGHGLMVLVGVREGDTTDDMLWLAQKTVNLAVSQFTLNASTKKGNRPSYIHAAGHDLAVPLYDAYCDEVARLLGKPTQRGVFGAEMQVALVNDGPVTIIIDSRLRE